MSDETDDDKQYEASQKKLDDARAKGEISKSADLTTAASYLGILAVLLTLAPQTLVGLAGALMVALDQATELSEVMFAGAPTPLMGGLLYTISTTLSPWFFVPAALALLSIFGQNAMLFTPSKIAPKLSRISPISGAKNKFGRQGLFEFFKSFTKLMIYGTVLGLILNSKMNEIVASMNLAPGMILVRIGELIITLMLAVVCISAALGMIDFLWQRAEHQRKHRMSRKEMTDEMKQTEGDPHLKQKRREKGSAIAMNAMLLDVPKADVVIVNPTHYAVALQWSPTDGAAPICVAKGVDEIAARIREIAAEHAVPLHSDPPTARLLHATIEIGDEISPDTYAAVAAAIRFAQEIRSKTKGY